LPAPPPHGACREGDDSATPNRDAEKREERERRREGAPTEIDRRASARERIYENANNLLTSARDSCIYRYNENTRSIVSYGAGPDSCRKYRRRRPSAETLRRKQSAIRRGRSFVAANSLVRLLQLRVSRIAASETFNTRLSPKSPINPRQQRRDDERSARCDLVCVAFTRTTARFIAARRDYARSKQRFREYFSRRINPRDVCRHRHNLRNAILGSRNLHFCTIAIDCSFMLNRAFNVSCCKAKHVRQLSIVSSSVCIISDIPLKMVFFLLSELSAVSLQIYVNATHMDTHMQEIGLSWIDTK